jgi:hypothetical protein
MAPATIEPDVRRMKRTTTVGNEYADWKVTGFYVADFEATINQELDRLASLPANWDHEGAPRIDPVIIQAARQFISQLPQDIAPLPAVVPSAAGNLQFEWNAGRRSLELEIEKPSVVHYLKWDPSEGVEEEDTFEINATDRAVFLIQWFIKGAGDA